MPTIDPYDALDQICCDFEEGWKGPSLERLAELVEQGVEFGIERSEILAELLGIEFDQLSSQRISVDRRAYDARFPDQPEVIQAAIENWVLRALEASLNDGIDARIESWFDHLQLDKDDHRICDILFQEHRLRRMYRCVTREYDYARYYPKHWPALKKELLLQGLLEDELTVVQFDIVTGPHSGESFRFSEHDSIVIGRGSRCRVRLVDDPYFSRYHFRIEINPPLCHLVDLQSRNGTFVNAQRVKEAILRSGDQISGGQTLIRARIEGKPIQSHNAQVDVSRTSPATVVEAEPDLSSLEIENSAFAFEHSSPSSFSQSSRFEPEAPPHAMQVGHSPINVNSTQNLIAKLEANLLTGHRLKDLSTIDNPIDFGSYQIVKTLTDHPYRKSMVATTLNGSKGVVIKLVQTAKPATISELPFLGPENPYRKFTHNRATEVIAIGQVDNWFYRMESLVETVDVLQALSNKPMEKRVQLAIGLIRLAAEMLTAAHTRGLLHGNIHPNNLLVYKSEKRLGLQVSDLGHDYNLQRAGILPLAQLDEHQGFSRHAFMAPERILESRHYSELTDLYSLSAVLYYYLAEVPPVSDLHAQDSMVSILNGSIKPIGKLCPELPRHLTQLIEQAMNPNPEKRPRSIREFSAALKSVVMGS